MKQHFFILFILISSLSANEEPKPFKILNICDLTQEQLDNSEEFPSDVAIKLSPGVSFPVHLFLKGDILSFVKGEEPKGSVEVNQTFYVRKVQDGVLFSTDLVKWSSFVEFVTGGASISLDMKEDQTSFSAGVTIDRRS